MSIKFEFKVVVVGDEKVGKTSLIIRYTENRFSESYKQTIGSDIAIKYVHQEDKDSTKPFDVVIIDLNIRGGMGGKETIKNLLEIDPKVKGLVSSANSTDPLMIDFEKHGFSGAVNKPYNIEELSRTLDKLIGWV